MEVARRNLLLVGKTSAKWKVWESLSFQGNILINQPQKCDLSNLGVNIFCKNCLTGRVEVEEGEGEACCKSRDQLWESMQHLGIIQLLAKKTATEVYIWAKVESSRFKFKNRIHFISLSASLSLHFLLSNWMAGILSLVHLSLQALFSALLNSNLMVMGIVTWWLRELWPDGGWNSDLMVVKSNLMVVGGQGEACWENVDESCCSQRSHLVSGQLLLNWSNFAGSKPGVRGQLSSTFVKQKKSLVKFCSYRSTFLNTTHDW